MSDTGLRPEDIAQAAADAIADAAGRSARDAVRVLADAGLTGVCAREAVGGLGLAIDFALPIARAAGQAQLAFPLLEQLLVARALGASPLATALCRGERSATWALQGSLATGLAGSARGAPEVDWVMVSDDHGGAALCDRASLDITEDVSLDPDHPQAWLSLDRAEVLARVDPAAVTALTRELSVLVAAFVHGVAAAALARTVEYTSTRVQFGRPLAQHQAVRHHLARMCLANEAVDASVHRLLTPDPSGQPRDARAVLAHALTQAAAVVEKAIQLHGGMGFTWDVPLHRGLREIRKFDAAFGAGALARSAAQSFIAAA